MTGCCVKARNIRYYKCSAHYATVNGATWCRGSIRADEAESKVWGKIEHLLQHPDLIAQEVAQYQDGAAQAQDVSADELRAIQVALRRCDREEQRWAEAYAAEVIDLTQFQGYKTEITMRRQSLLAQQAMYERQQQDMEEQIHHGQLLIDCCARVREHLKAFTGEDKRLAFDALNMRMTWTPGDPLRIQVCIPSEPVVSIPSCWRSSGIA
jgi:hypothetical protein